MNEADIPEVMCPDCDSTMAYVPWKTRPGGRLLCDCGRRIRVMWENNHWLPEFYGPQGAKAGREVPIPGPAELAKRRAVLNCFVRRGTAEEAGARSMVEQAEHSRDGWPDIGIHLVHAWLPLEVLPEGAETTFTAA